MKSYKAYVCIIQEDFLRLSAENDQQAKDNAWNLLKESIFKNPNNFDVEIQVEEVLPAQPHEPCPECQSRLMPRWSGGVRCTQCMYWFDH